MNSSDMSHKFLNLTKEREMMMMRKIESLETISTKRLKGLLQLIELGILSLLQPEECLALLVERRQFIETIKLSLHLSHGVGILSADTKVRQEK